MREEPSGCSSFGLADALCLQAKPGLLFATAKRSANNSAGSKLKPTKRFPKRELRGKNYFFFALRFFVAFFAFFAFLAFFAMMPS